MIKTAVFVLLGISLAGYIYQTRNILTRFRVPKLQGHHLLYQSIFTGAVLYFVSSLFFIITWPLTKNWSLFYDYASFVFIGLEYSDFRIYCILINSFLIAYFWTRLKNYAVKVYYWSLVNQKHISRLSQENKELPEVPGKRNENKLRGLIPRTETDSRCLISHYLLEEENEQHALAIMSVAFDSPKPVLVTLSNNRCYVGVVSAIKLPSDGNITDGISIYPYCSGYRDQRLCLQLTTYYTETLVAFSETKAEIDKLSETEKAELINTVENYRISFSFEDIVSLALFDLMKYPEFKRQEQTVKSNPSTEKSVN